MRRLGRSVRLAPLIAAALAAVIATTPSPAKAPSAPRARAAATDRPIPCGAEVFPQFPEEVYAQPARRARPAFSPHVGTREALWTYNYRTSQYDHVDFTCRAVDKHCAILVADSAAGKITDTEIIDITDRFERRAPGHEIGIYDVLSQTFAQPDTVLGDPRIYIALTTIESNYDGGFIAGYVTAGDRLARSANSKSNERHLIVLDIGHGWPIPRSAWVTFRQQTLTHEFFHIIHNGIDRAEDGWINEGIATFSQTLCGFDGEDGEEYFKDTGVGLIETSGDLPSLADYDKSFLLIRYLADRYGDDFVGDVARSPAHGVGSVDGVFTAWHVSDRFRTNVFPAWAVANLARPGTDPVYAYKTYDPLVHQPAKFGDVGSVPIVRSNISLSTYGVHYLCAGSAAEGQIAYPTNSGWAVESVIQQDGSVRLVRPWYATSPGMARDCSPTAAWDVIAASGAPGTYSLTLNAPSMLLPTVAARTPIGTGVSAYQTEVRTQFADVDPTWQIDVSLVSERYGALDRTLRIDREPLAGRCGVNVTVSDVTGTPLPPADVITVHIGDVRGPFGSFLPSTDASWQFTTDTADTQPPQVTIGILANPVLRERLTALVISNEPLHPDPDGPVRLAVNGTETVPLTAEDATGQHWIGTFAVSAAGQYDFLVLAADVAGNPVAPHTARYVVTIGDGGVLARRADGRQRPMREEGTTR